MKRLIWTLAMAIVGFGLGWHSQGAPSDRGNVATATIWAACIGFGFGSIFDKRRPRNGLLVLYWAFTLALIGAFFSPLVPLAQFAAQVVVAGAAGALLGVVIGVAQLKYSNRRQSASG
jgi:hypothetical protein